MGRDVKMELLLAPIKYKAQRMEVSNKQKVVPDSIRRLVLFSNSGIGVFVQDDYARCSGNN
jgi:hypothetical protein